MAEITGKHVLLKDKDGNYLLPETVKTNTIAENNMNVPTSDAVSKAISNHTHTKSQITDFGSYAASNHNHDNSYAAKSHNHDSSYAAKSHTHTKSQITDLPTCIVGVPNYTNRTQLPLNINSSGKYATCTATKNGWVLVLCYDEDGLEFQILVDGTSIGRYGTNHGSRWSAFFPVRTNSEIKITYTNTNLDELSVYIFPFA